MGISRAGHLELLCLFEGIYPDESGKFIFLFYLFDLFKNGFIFACIHTLNNGRISAVSSFS